MSQTNHTKTKMTDIKLDSYTVLSVIAFNLMRQVKQVRNRWNFK